MEILIELRAERIELPSELPPARENSGAVVEFRGVVRGIEDGKPIRALRYEAYETMASREMRRILEDLSTRHPCIRVIVWHRYGWIPVGETAVFVRVESRHRVEGFALLAAFMDRLKTEVPIWKVESAS
jgi:molybdopterin synthase catalytic subunit